MLERKCFGRLNCVLCDMMEKIILLVFPSFADGNIKPVSNYFVYKITTFAVKVLISF